MSYPELERRLAHFTEDEINVLRLSYSVAHKAHEGQKRKSGEDYIEHPIAVATILADMNMDLDTIVAGLLRIVRLPPKISKLYLVKILPTWLMVLANLIKLSLNLNSKFKLKIFGKCYWRWPEISVLS